MHFRTLTAAEFTRPYGELRNPEQTILPSGAGAIQSGHHPLYGAAATVHDGETIGLVLRDEPLDQAALPGRRSCPISEGGAAFASVAAFASIGLIAAA